MGILTTASLEALEHADQRRIMDLVDKLKRIGLDSVLQLPQIVVCGDQSSGKSSVLEAITEIPFPRKENLCTRFATEIVLLRASNESIETSIIPDKGRSKYGQEKLGAFAKTIKDFSELPALIEEATELMGLGPSIDSQVSPRAFARDVLQIKVSGPKRVQLTVVDLPGLIHSGNKSQTDADVSLIHDLVQEYIESPRTIILAVVSAKNDYANQVITKKCREVDPKGSRTLGIITKPDFLIPASSNEQDWIDLALNKDIYFELGWHVVKNRGDTEKGTFEERNVAEEAFFNRGAYRERLPRSSVGIVPLRERLSRLLNNHLKRELPSLRMEVEQSLAEVTTDLSRLGKKRSTSTEQKQYLLAISMKCHDILKAAANGDYDGEFFQDSDRGAKLDDNIRRLRAVVQHLNLDFARVMRMYGQRYKMSSAGKASAAMEDSGEDIGSDADITAVKSPNATLEQAKVAFGTKLFGSSSTIKQVNGAHGEQNVTIIGRSHGLGTSTPANSSKLSGTLTSNVSNIKSALPAGFPKAVSRAEAVDWVLRVLQRSRGRELPGTFNPMLISQLFWEQSEHWETIAMAHIERVAAKCAHFVDLVLAHVAPEEVACRLETLHVESALKASVDASRNELKRIIKDKSGHPITYNHYYTTTLQKVRKRKYTDVFSRATEKAKVNIFDKGFTHRDAMANPNFVDLAELNKNAGLSIEQNMDRFSAEEALDSEMAYYKDELKYFIGVVTKQIVERHLVGALTDTVLSPMVIASMSEEETAFAAAEAPEITQQRDFLEHRRSILEDGQATFRKAMGAFR